MSSQKKTNPIVFLIIAVVVIGVIIFFTLSGGETPNQQPRTSNQGQQQPRVNIRSDADSDAESLDALTIGVGELEQQVQESEREKKNFQEEQRRIAIEANERAEKAERNTKELEQKIAELQKTIRNFDPEDITKAVREIKEYQINGGVTRNNNSVGASGGSANYALPKNDKGEPLVDANGFVTIIPLDHTTDPDATKTKKTKKSTEQEFPPIPVYTFNVGSTNIKAVTMSALVGKVPKSGKVNDPFRFKIVAGDRLLTSNGHDIAGIEKTIILGTAVGDPSINCVVGTITDVSFVFTDGTISHTQSKSTTTGTGKGLGYISGPRGLPCIRGKRQNNFSSFLTSRLIADTVRFTGQAYADAARELTRFGDNSAVLSVSDRSDLIAGRVGEGAGLTIGNMIEQQTASIFDIVWAPAGTEVTINFEEPIEVNYDPVGRRTDYNLLTRKSLHALD